MQNFAEAILLKLEYKIECDCMAKNTWTIHERRLWVLLAWSTVQFLALIQASPLPDIQLKLLDGQSISSDNTTELKLYE